MLCQDLNNTFYENEIKRPKLFDTDRFKLKILLNFRNFLSNFVR